MKAGEQIGTLTMSLRRALKEVDALKKKGCGHKKRLGELCKGKEHAEYERDGLEAKLERAQCEREKFTDAVSRV